MIQSDNTLMKWLASGDSGGDPSGQGARGAAPGRSQDDAAVGYVFQRTPQDPEFPPFAPKQQRWALGDDTVIDNHDKWKYPPPPAMSNTPSSQMNQMNQIKSVTSQPSQQQQLMLAAAQAGLGTAGHAHLSSGLLPTIQGHPGLGGGLVLQSHQQGLYELHQHQQMQQVNGVNKGAEHLMFHLGQPGVLTGPSPGQFVQQSQNQLGLNHIGGVRSPVSLHYLFDSSTSVTSIQLSLVFY